MMNRADFIKMTALLGLGLTAQPMPALSRQKQQRKKVLVIGAGAAGLTAAYLLRQQGIEVDILEASSNYGGRMKRIEGFVDFPLPMGAEWIHTEPSILRDIVNDSNRIVGIDTMSYDPEKDFGLLDGQRITLQQAGFKSDYKFVNSTWFDFFSEYIVPSIEDRIHFDQIVNEIDYSKEEIIVTVNNQKHTADYVIVTVPLKMLQKNAIAFTPSLPNSKQRAIERATVWDGFKAFIEFKKPFYPAFTVINIEPETDGQKVFYDAAYGQNSQHHVLGLFSVGTGAEPYLSCSEKSLIESLLEELDMLFNGQASENYVQHIAQNWNKEPFIQGAYLYDHENFTLVRKLGKSINDKLFFAGEAYTNGLNWAGVNAAAISAMRAVRQISKKIK